MNEKDTPFNLFSSSGKKPSRSAPKKDPAPVSLPASLPPAKKEGKFDSATQAMFDEIQRMQDDITSKLDFITTRSGMTHDQVLKMVEAPGTSKGAIEKMNADLKAFSEKVWDALGTDIMPRKEKSVKSTSTVKERKVKTLGDRKNWLRMR